jgi:hypothetical protein
MFILTYISNYSKIEVILFWIMPKDMSKLSDSKFLSSPQRIHVNQNEIQHYWNQTPHMNSPASVLMSYSNGEFFLT